jgi:predicted phosphoribosyltransferase
VRAQKPKKLIGAVAVASPDAARAMLHEADAMVCLKVPSEFQAVGQFFTDFSQVSDEDVAALLQQNDSPVSAAN